jgi:hypothetical protein
VKSFRVLSRLAILALAAAALVGLTGIYGGSRPPALPSANWQAERQHRPSAPQASDIQDVVGNCVVLAVFAFAGRVIFRLRLSPVSRSRSERQLIVLDLQRKRGTAAAVGASMPVQHKTNA